MSTAFRPQSGPVPLIGVVADSKMVDPHRFHMAGEKYLTGVVNGADALPVIIPSLPEPLAVAPLLDKLDGLLFTGGYSNVEPHHYEGEPSKPGTLHDALRDHTTLPLLRAAVDAGVPLLGICRGFQEMNIAWGGTLHQELHETGLFMEHRENKDDRLEQQYSPAHDVTIEPGGLLAELVGEGSQQVNSLHTQGIDRLGIGLQVEARASDGLIEAISVPDSKAFTLAVQWHPEWKVNESPFYLSIFQAFGKACAARAAGRQS